MLLDDSEDVDDSRHPAECTSSLSSLLGHRRLRPSKVPSLDRYETRSRAPSNDLRI